MFGSLLVVKGAVINHYASSARDLGRALAGDHYSQETATASFTFLQVDLGDGSVSLEYILFIPES